MYSARTLRAGLLAAALGCLAASRLLALGTPVLTKPAHASTGHVPHPSFFWNAVPGADSYRCEVATDAAFTRIVSVREGITVPRHVPLDALPPGTYHWRVTAHADGAASTSATFTHTVAGPTHTIDVLASDSLAAIRAKLASAAATPRTAVNFPQNGAFVFDLASDAEAFLFTLSGATDLIINGRGSSIVLKNKAHAGFLKLSDSTRVTVRDFVVDYDPVAHSLVRVVANRSTTSTLDLEVELMPIAGQSSPWYPELTDNPAFTSRWSWAVLLDKDRPGRLKRGVSNAFGLSASSSARLNPGGTPARYRLHHPGSPSGPLFAPGDPVAMLCRTNVGSFASTTRVTDLTFAGITSYASPMGNYYSFDGSELKVLRCRSLLRDSTRLLSANADGVHAHGNLVGPWVEGCTFIGNGDDGVALYNKGMAVTAKTSTTSLVVSATWMHLKAGDVFRVFDPVGGVFLGASHTATGVTAGGGGFVVTFTPALSSADYAAITFPADHDRKFQLFNMTRRNGRFVVLDNTLTVRGRGVIVRSPDGEISGSAFVGCSSSAIAVHNEPAFWFNGAYSRNLAILDNTVADSGFDTLALHAGAIDIRFNRIDTSGSKSVDVLAGGTLHERITVAGNTVTDFARHGIYLANTAHGVVSDNRFIGTSGSFVHAGERHGIVATRTHGARVTYNDFLADARPRTSDFHDSQNTGLVHAPAPLDNAAPSGVSLSGAWTAGTGVPGYHGADYLFTTAGGSKSVFFAPPLAQSRAYEVQTRWTAHANRASNVPIDVVHAGGVHTSLHDQRSRGGEWVGLGQFTLTPGQGHGVRIRTQGTDGYVVADAVRLVPVP